MSIRVRSDDIRLVQVFSDGRVEQVNLTEAVIGILRVRPEEWKESDLVPAQSMELQELVAELLIDSQPSNGRTRAQYTRNMKGIAARIFRRGMSAGFEKRQSP
jgi:hypothetical protein